MTTETFIGSRFLEQETGPVERRIDFLRAARHKRAKPPMKTIILLLILAPVVAFSTSLDRPHDISITADALVAAYDENEVAANAKYSGVRVGISGAVYKVSVDTDGDPYVVFAGHRSGTILNVRCKFSRAYNAKVATLRVGSLIGVHGIVTGKHGSNVIVKDCSL
jgi:tRNA_anti-like